MAQQPDPARQPILDAHAEARSFGGRNAVSIGSRKNRADTRQRLQTLAWYVGAAFEAMDRDDKGGTV